MVLTRLLLTLCLAAPVACFADPPARVEKPAAELEEAQGLLFEVVVGDYEHCLVRTRDGRELNLWPDRTLRQDCRDFVGKQVTVRFRRERKIIPEAGNEEVELLTLVEIRPAVG